MFFNLGMQEMLIVGVVAVLLFGKRLPEVARSLGGSYREFRKGLSEMQAHMHFDESSINTRSQSSYYGNDDFDDYEQPTAPKFEPPTSEPTLDGDEAQDGFSAGADEGLADVGLAGEVASPVEGDAETSSARTSGEA
jgi:sec-independent protein translocase protein TatA